VYVLPATEVRGGEIENGNGAVEIKRHVFLYNGPKAAIDKHTPLCDNSNIENTFYLFITLIACPLLFTR